MKEGFFFFFFFISGNWAGDPCDVNSAPFPPFTNALGHLHPKGTSFINFTSSILFISFTRLVMPFFYATITCPHLDKFYLKRIDRALAHPESSFHSLVTLRHLAAWGLGLEPTEENLAHKETTRRSMCRLSLFSFFFFLFFLCLTLYFSSLQG